LVVDPLVSFGVGESRVNDAAQGLIEAGRRINRALDCGVIYVQHSGKQNARDKAVDQYAGRSGSAMPDGSRLVAVMNPVTPEDWQKTTGQALADGATGLLVTLPKLSYAPQQAPLYFERNGYAFRHVSCEKLTPDMEAAVHDARVLEFLKDGAAKGSSYSKQMLESIGVEGLNRNEVRAALARLEAANRIKPGKGPGARIQVLDTRPPMGSQPQNLPTTFPNSNVGPWTGVSR
jgi:RecA-family ATPase